MYISAKCEVCRQLSAPFGRSALALLGWLNYLDAYSRSCPNPIFFTRRTRASPKGARSERSERSFFDERIYKKIERSDQSEQRSLYFLCVLCVLCVFGSKKTLKIKYLQSLMWTDLRFNVDRFTVNMDLFFYLSTL